MSNPRPNRALTTDGTPWQQLGACLQVDDPDVMFPTNERNKAAVRAAKVYCFACTVRVRCLTAALTEEDGLSRDDRHGIRGGLTSTERMKLAASQRPTPKRSSGREPAPCGTPAAYERHIRNGEPIDDACRTAKSKQRQANREKAAAA